MNILPKLNPFFRKEPEKSDTPTTDEVIKENIEVDLKQEAENIVGATASLSSVGQFLTKHNFIVVELGDITDRTLIDNLTKRNAQLQNELNRYKNHTLTSIRNTNVYETAIASFKESDEYRNLVKKAAEYDSIVARVGILQDELSDYVKLQIDNAKLQERERYYSEANSRLQDHLDTTKKLARSLSRNNSRRRSRSRSRSRHNHSHRSRH